MKLVMKCLVLMVGMMSVIGYASTKYTVQARVSGDKDLYQRVCIQSTSWFSKKKCANEAGTLSKTYDGKQTIMILDKKGTSVRALAGSCAQYVNEGAKLQNTDTMFYITVQCNDPSNPCKKLKMTVNCG